MPGRRARYIFARPPWNTESSEWIALDGELGLDHPVRQIARLVDDVLNLDALIRTYAGRGSKPHRPELLLKLVIYEHSLGRPQPVQWMRDLEENKAVQWLAYGMRPSQTTLYEFRDRVQPLLQNLNQQVIRSAIDEGHTDGSRGALDGTTVAANATRHRMVNLDTVEKRLEILDREIREAERAEELTPAIESTEPDVLPSLTASIAESSTPLSAPIPESPTKPASWKAKTTRGKKRQRDRCRRAKTVLQAQHAANTHRRKDKRKENAKIRVALGDPMAPFGLDKLKTFRPLYNIQTMSDVETDLVLAYETTRTTADSGQLLPMIDQTTKMTDRPLKEVLADSGYPSGEDLAACEQKEVIVYAPWNENSFTEAKRAKGEKEGQIPKDRFTYDPSIPSYRCPEGKPLTYRERTTKQKANGDYFTIEIYQADPLDCADCPLKASCVRGRSGARTVRRQEHEELVEGLKERMKTPDAKAIYGKRGCTVELRFADWKTHRGLQRFSGQTPERADAQVGLIVLAHNLRTLEKLRARRGEQLK
jgi:transposase